MALTKVKASNITLTTPSASSNDVTPATTEYVTTALANLVDSAPSTLNTLNELAAALGDDANFSTTVTNSIAGKLPLAGGTMTGHIQLNNAVELRSKDTSSNIKTITRVNNSNELEYGWSGSGPVKFMGGGSYTERMRIHTNGNIGIGVDSGPHTLSVKGTISRLNSTGIQVTNLQTNNDHGQISILNSGGVQKVLLDSNGNSSFNGGFLGIGTSSPRYNLTVAGNNATAIGIGLDNTSGSSTLDIAALGSGYNNHQAGAGEVWFYSPDNINIGGATGNTNDVKFIANNSVNMVIKGDGKVGIGNTTPAHKLDVEAGANEFDLFRVGSSISDNSEVTIGYFDANATNGIPGLIGASDFGGLIQGGEHGNLVLGIRDNDATDGVAILSGGGNFMSDSTYDTIVAKFRADGNVGIGTNTPSVKLYVLGNHAANYLGIFYHDGNDNNRYGLRILAGSDTATDGQIWMRFDDGDGHAQGYIQHSSGTVLVGQSDERLKENIIDSPLEGINTLKQIQQREFNWKKDVNKTKTIGYIAQELETVYPAAVTTVSDESGQGVVAPDDDPDNPYKFVAKERLIDVLIKATQEQQEQIEAMKKEIEELKG